jgi:hypothetical protein
MPTFTDYSTVVTASWLNSVDAIATDPAIVALAGVDPATNKLPYFTGPAAAALATFTDTGRAIVGSATPAEALTYLGGISSDNCALTGSTTAQSLSVAGSPVWTQSTLTDVSQLANGPSYITASALSGYAPLASPAFTGTVTGVTASMVGLGNVTNESKGTMFTNPTFTGSAALPSTWSIGGTTITATPAQLNAVGTVSDPELVALAGLTSAADTLPYFTGSGTASTTTMTAAGRALLDDANAAAQLATLGAAPLASPTFTGTVSGVTAAMVGLGNVTNESKGTMFSSPTFTGTVSSTTLQMGGSTVWTQASLTNLNQLTNGPGFITSAGIPAGLTVFDTRASATTPETTASPIVRFDFKQNSTESLSDGGTYFGEMSMRQYGNVSDWSGGKAHQLGFTDNSNIWHRSGTSTTWGSWSKLWDSVNLTNLNQLTNGPGYTTNVGTVTSVGGTGTVSGLTLSGTVATSGNLTLGGTLSVTPSNFASQTANYALLAPNGSAGTPTFRALVDADLPASAMRNRGSVADTSRDTAVLAGHYNVTYSGYSNSMLVWDVAGSTGPVQMEFNYAGAASWRNKTDSTTWTAWRTIGTVTGVSGTAPVVSSGGNTPAISMAAAASGVPGYLTAADWATFNGKQAALGFTPVNKAGDALTGVLIQPSGRYVDSPAAMGVIECAPSMNGTTIPNGYLKLVTPIKTSDYQMFSIDVVGYDYNVGKSIDFTVVGYAYDPSAAVIQYGFSNRSSFSRQVRAVLEDRGGGGGSNRVLVIALGDESSAGNCSQGWYFQKLTATVRLWAGLAYTATASQFSWVQGETTLAAGYFETANLNNLVMDGDLGTLTAAGAVVGSNITSGGNTTGNAATATALSAGSDRTKLDNRAPLADPTFTGVVTIPLNWKLGTTTVACTGSELNHLMNCTNNVQYQLDTKAQNFNASFTGTTTGITAAMVGLGNVTNESKATMFASPTFTGTVTMPTPFTLGATSVTATGAEMNYLSGATSNIQTQLNALAGGSGTTDAELLAIAALTSAADRLPYFTGSGTAALATFTSAGRDLVAGANVTAQKTTLGLENVTNESKATMFNNPTFTGTVTGAGGKLKSQLYTSGSGNWTWPDGVDSCWVTLVGGGGGGGGGNNAASTGNGSTGGGGGETLYKFPFPRDGASTTAYSVGAAGSAGAAGVVGVQTGGAGGNSTFGSLQAIGGSGGYTASLTLVGKGGGQYQGTTVAANGVIQGLSSMSGANGGIENSFAGNADQRFGGASGTGNNGGGGGGASMFGSGGRGGNGTTGSGIDATGYGGGGGGAATNPSGTNSTAGGAGSAGYILIEWVG